MAIVDGQIRCSGCGEMKSLDSFAPSLAKRGRGRCRPCHVRYAKGWIASASPESVEQVRATRRRYYATVRDSKLASARARRADPAWRERRRGWTLSATYGLTAAEYDRLLAAQGGGCACCGAIANGSGKRLFVDHDHVTGAVRGILCHRCNAGIGALGDDVAGVRRALAYLERAEFLRVGVPSVRINLIRGVDHGIAA